MKYIKLFEAFNNDSITDYRIQIVHDDMKEGIYLLSSKDEDHDSFFGVFNLQGLKDLEDALNTQVIVNDLSNKQQTGGELPLIFENTGITFQVNEIDASSKFMRILDEDEIEMEITWGRGSIEKDLGLFGISTYDLPDVDLGVMKMKDLPFGSYLTKNVLSMGLILLPSKGPSKKGNSIDIPIVLNQCHSMDNHGTIIESKSSETIADFIERLTAGIDLFEKTCDLNDIEKYLPKIFDDAVPKGFIKILNKLKSFDAGESSDLVKFNKEFSKLENVDFVKAQKQAEKQAEKHRPNIPLPKEGDAKDRERFRKEANESQIEFVKIQHQILKDYTEDILLDMDNLINKYKEIIKGYTFEEEKKFVDYYRELYDRGSKGLAPPGWTREWPILY